MRVPDAVKALPPGSIQRREKELPTIERYLALAIKGIGDEVRTGKFDRVIAQKDALRRWTREQAVKSLRNLAKEILEYADRLDG